MSSPLARTLLSLAAFGTFALAVGWLSRADLRWELWTAALLGLLVYNAGYPAITYPLARRPTSGAARTTDVCPQAHALPGEPRSGPARRARKVAPAVPRSLPDGLPQSFGLTMLDRERRVVWWNDSAAMQLGLDGEGDVGRPLAALVRHPSLAAYLAAGNFSKTLRMQTAGADGPILSLQFVPYVASGCLVLSRNLERPTHLDALRCESIANVSHELRAPLAVLAGYLETVRELKPDASESRDYLDRMDGQCKRMQRIIDNLLRLSAYEAAPEPSSNERVDVSRMLSNIRSEAEALSAGRHRIMVEAEGSFDLLGAECEIASAFGNLASNAIRYTEPGGLVRIVWRASRAGAEFAVEDTGIGIEKEHIPHLTERFYCADRSRQRGGSGLGLAIVKLALIRHQGALEIESEPGRGSRFTVRFPAHRVVAAAA